MGNFRHRHKNFHVPSFPRAILHNHLPWSSFLHTLILRCYQELTHFGIFKCVRYSCKYFCCVKYKCHPPHKKKNGQKCSCSRIFYLFYVGNSIRHFFVDHFFQMLQMLQTVVQNNLFSKLLFQTTILQLVLPESIFANCRCESFFFAKFANCCSIDHFFVSCISFLKIWE